MDILKKLSENDSRIRVAKIENHRGYYITTLGCIYSTKIISEGRKLVQNKSLKVGYCRVLLTDNGHIATHKLVHRLVALAFIPNPDNLPIVCHKDDDPSNNNINNLFWGDTSNEF